MTIHWDIGRSPCDASGDLGAVKSRYFAVQNLHIRGAEREVIIRLAKSRGQVDAVCDLINERYAWRGYGDHHRIDLNDHHATFSAEIDGEVVGTITLAVDGMGGLAVDRTFPDQMLTYRRSPGVKLCELTKFAFDPAVQSKQLMALLFHAAFVYGLRTYGCTDLFIEVNPRHTRFYEAMLGFERVGELSHNDSVAAPSQLMLLKVEAIRRNIDWHAGTGATSAARSLYPFFLSPQQEDAIYGGLIGADGRSFDDGLGNREQRVGWLDRLPATPILAGQSVPSMSEVVRH